MQNRRKFIQSVTALTIVPAFAKAYADVKEDIMTVNGAMLSKNMGFTLTHEHVLVDFIGADKINKNRYNAEEVYNIALPKLIELKKAGCSTLVECTPAYLGRDVQLLQRLSQESGLNVLTNTGYYGAAKEKFLPSYAYDETAEQISKRWISEFENGIEGTQIKPGFIKLGVDTAPLSEAHKKIVQASAVTHLQTGLTVGIHSGDGAAAEEELNILMNAGVSPEAYIWIHAQNEKDFSYFKKLAEKGAWVEFDGINKDSLEQNLKFVQYMKANNLLHKILLSHDSGWYHVGEEKGGIYEGYTTIFTSFIPLLKQNKFTNEEIDTIFKRNPQEAFKIRKKRL